MKTFTYVALLLLAFTAHAFAAVVIDSPGNGSTSANPVHFVASASTTCSSGVASMGVYVNNVLKYVGNGASLNTEVGLDPGVYNAVVQEWDYCGGVTNAATTVTVGNGQSGVSVSLPANNSTVNNPTSFVATATSSCSKGVAALGVYVNGQRIYLTDGDTLNTQLNLAAGQQQAIIQEWDNCGGSSATPVNITVSPGTSFWNL